MTRYYIAIENTPELNPLSLAEALLHDKYNASDSFERLSLFLYRTKFIRVQDEVKAFWILEVEVDVAYCEIDVRKHLKRLSTVTNNFLIKITDPRAIKEIISQQSYSYADLAKYATHDLALAHKTLVSGRQNPVACNDGVYQEILSRESEHTLIVQDSPAREYVKKIDINGDELSEFSPLLEIKPRNYSSQSKFQRLICFYERHQVWKKLLYKFLSAGGGLNKKYIINCYANGFEFAISKLWPLTLTGLISHDLIIYYLYPTQRYNENLSTLFLGSSGNQYSYASNFGSYLIDDVNGWLWLGLAFATPTLFGCINALYHYWVIRKFANSLISTETKDLALKNSFKLYAVYEAIRWIPELSAAKQRELFDCICDAASDGSVFAAKIVAELADPHQVDLQAPEILALQHSALTNLSILKPRDKEFLPARVWRNIYRNYLLWSLGQNTQWLWHCVFLPLALIRDSSIVYSALHLFTVGVRKLIQLIDFFISKNNCEAENKVWTYLNDWADYYCSWCGDWDFIYQGDVFNSTSCWTELLAQPRSSQQLIAAITRFSGLNLTENMDVSQQNWGNWTLDEWQRVLQSINASNTHLAVFNLSQAGFNPYFTNQNRILALADLLSQLPTSILSLANQGLGADLVNRLMRVLDYSTMTSLDLSGNNISDQGLINLAPSFPVGLQALSIGQNQISDYGLGVFLSAISGNNSLTELDVSANSLSSLTPQILADFIPYSLMRTINLSGNDFSAADLSVLWQACTLTNQSLSTIIIADANLGDMQLASLSTYLPRISVNRFDLSDNYLSDQSVASFMFAAGNSSVTWVDFSGNIITDYSIQAIADYIANTTIDYLGLARGSYSLTNMPQMLQAVANSEVIGINFSGNLLSDSFALMLADSLQQPECKLRFVDISANQLSNVGAQAVTTASSVSPLENLSLANNQIQCLIASNMTSLGYSLQIVDVSNNLIDDDCLIKLSSLLVSSNLKQINLFQVAISDRSALVFAKSLVTPVVQENNLLDEGVSLDMRRQLYDLTPVTNLAEFNVGENYLSNATLRVYCRILYGSRIPLSKAILGPNPGENNTINWQSCQTSSSASLQPPIALRVFKNIYDAASSQLRKYIDNKNNREATKPEVEFKQDEDNVDEYGDESSQQITFQSIPKTYHSSLFNTPIQPPAQPQISSNNASQPWMLGMITGVIPIVLAIILIYLIYRIIAPSISKLISKTSSLFNKSHDLSKFIKENKPANDPLIIMQCKR